MLGHSLTLAVLVAVGVHTVSAQVTNIFLPDVDSQPLIMTELGAGADGRTTFLISPGTPTNSQEDVAPPFTATYVVGPSDVAWYLTQDGQTGQELCSIGADGTATCVESGGGMTTTYTEQYTTDFPVQFAGAGKPAGPTGTGTGTASATAPSNTSGAAPSKMTAVSGSGPKTTAPTGTGSAPPSTPSNAGCAVLTSPLSLGIVTILALALGRAL